MICKLDIEKAFDSINWQFLMKIVRRMGFGPKWTRWIWQCISTARFSVLVNEVPTGFFPSSKGLRQGYSLSPYLFILGMEVLSILLIRAMTGGFISGCNIKGREGAVFSISHLLYADDTIIFCEAKADQLLYLSWVLLWFEASSGMKINLNKSKLIPVGAMENLDALPVELGYRTGHLPTTSLGLPLGATHKSVTIWDSIEEKMQKRLALWKRNFISKGGRITLIKSTLTSLPLYQMSIFRMPNVVAKRLENLERCYLWGGGARERKAHLVNWDVVCSEKRQGSPSLRKPTLLNKALLGKWIWRFAFDRDCTWKTLINTKYVLEGLGWCSKEACGPFRVGL